MSKAKRKVGRPTKYHKIYIEKMLEHFGEGGWAESYCGEVGIAKDTFYAWLKKYPEFSDAYKIARMKSHLWWSQVIRGMAVGMEKFRYSNMGAVAMVMKNTHGWSDRPAEIEEPIDEVNFVH